jgi:hypothetical protein
MRTTTFWVITKRVVVISYRRVTLEDGTDSLYRDVSKKLPLLAVYRPRTVQFSSSRKLFQTSSNWRAIFCVERASTNIYIYIYIYIYYMNTSLKLVPGTPHVRKLERHKISSNLFNKNFHDVIFRSKLIWYHWIQQGWKFVVRSRSDPLSRAPPQVSLTSLRSKSQRQST